MVTLVLPRLAARAERRFQRAAAVAGRNVAAARHVGYWWVLVSGFFEPVLYLLSIGLGVGALIKGFTLPDGRTVSYAAFVAPAMLAASAMNGALAETTMNMFGKMKYMRLYDGVLATPVQPFEVALGELMWALVRGSIYSVAFLGIMVGMGLTSTGWAIAAFPATVIVGFAFGGMGMAIATYVRSWQDFDYIMVVQFAMFLFSGTFAPVDSYAWFMRIVVEVTPLYHGVQLLRGLATGALGWGLLGHVAYLIALASVGLVIAGRRMGVLLYK
ncbi:ABC transporter permease [Planosporangium flavigriseum]|uniref:Transport permease protein n=1 Tax=Planosporangium flavigriseum TaxID=373681 RepID=A0A8J3PN93_9ACTN|nr:ABC transporter permease [Planosporangium flavigriseum]NJC67133.1 ABC transporter permease [Planosporangium flavigriseum]GIG75752.1 transport permease protein [Planosporangium flavigriseum]